MEPGKDHDRPPRMMDICDFTHTLEDCKAFSPLTTGAGHLRDLLAQA
jgi:hypothetical protein